MCVSTSVGSARLATGVWWRRNPLTPARNKRTTRPQHARATRRTYNHPPSQTRHPLRHFQQLVNTLLCVLTTCMYCYWRDTSSRTALLIQHGDSNAPGAGSRTNDCTVARGLCVATVFSRLQLAIVSQPETTIPKTRLEEGENMWQVALRALEGYEAGQLYQEHIFFCCSGYCSICPSHSPELTLLYSFSVASFRFLVCVLFSERAGGDVGAHRSRRCRGDLIPEQARTTERSLAIHDCGHVRGH